MWDLQLAPSGARGPTGTFTMASSQPQPEPHSQLPSPASCLYQVPTSPRCGTSSWGDPLSIYLNSGLSCPPTQATPCFIWQPQRSARWSLSSAFHPPARSPPRARELLLKLKSGGESPVENPPALPHGTENQVRTPRCTVRPGPLPSATPSCPLFSAHSPGCCHVWFCCHLSPSTLPCKLLLILRKPCGAPSPCRTRPCARAPPALWRCLDPPGCAQRCPAMVSAPPHSCSRSVGLMGTGTVLPTIIPLAPSTCLSHYGGSLTMTEAGKCMNQ